MCVYLRTALSQRSLVLIIFLGFKDSCASCHELKLLSSLVARGRPWGKSVVVLGADGLTCGRLRSLTSSHRFTCTWCLASRWVAGWWKKSWGPAGLAAAPSGVGDCFVEGGTCTSNMLEPSRPPGAHLGYRCLGILGLLPSSGSYSRGGMLSAGCRQRSSPGSQPVA